MKILGIETSCDETGVAVVENGQKTLSNIVSSSVELHKKYGGVVPEIAAREQVKVIIPAIEEGLLEAKITLDQIDAIAVTVGPGLAGSLLVGTETAKTLGLVFRKPIVPVNHLIGHIYANWLTDYGLQSTARKKAVVSRQKAESSQPEFPLVVLIVSGGHTDLVLMTNHGKFKWLGGTRDDAAGEAFDKVARVLGLGYPGGPEIERAAAQTQNTKYKILNTKLPRPMIDTPDFDFSFSGLKTAVVNLVKNKKLTTELISEVAFEFQQAIVEVLVAKTLRAAQKYKVKQILLGGGVAANLALRTQLSDYSKKLGITVNYPPIELCIDNGAMIASAAFYNFKPTPAEKIQAQPGLHF